jgi:predicted enzyme related to lactoylglutathione lyase
MKIESMKFMLMVQDMDRAVAFYRDVLGLEVKYGSPMWTELAFGDAIVALHGGGTGESSQVGLSVTVDDVDAACAEVAAGGGRVASPPQDRAGEPIRLASVVDTEGNTFSLAQYIA